MSSRTTLLGVSYIGRPMMNSLACRLWLTEQKSGRSAAQAMLDAHNQINRAFGKPDVDLAADFTDLPLEGGEYYRRTERETAFDRVVQKSARS